MAHDAHMSPQPASAAPSGPVLEIWFDFASPYSFLAIERIEPIAAAAGVHVVYQPFLLGPIFKARGWDNSPFRLFPDKGEYMMREVARLADKYGVRYRRPTEFPRNSVLAARVALVGIDQPWGKDFCLGMFRANFVADLDIHDEGVARGQLLELGVDADQVLAQARSDEGKTALRTQVAKAQALGVFGAPTMFAAARVRDTGSGGREMFWGNDRVEDAVEWAAVGPGRKTDQSDD